MANCRMGLLRTALMMKMMTVMKMKTTKTWKKAILMMSTTPMKKNKKDKREEEVRIEAEDRTLYVLRKMMMTKTRTGRKERIDLRKKQCVNNVVVL